MIALLFAAVIAVVLLVCLWLGVALLVGVVKGTIENFQWLIRSRHGQDAGPPPWERLAPPIANTVPVPFEVRAAVWARDGGECVYCGATEDLTVDHVVPRAHGGSNDPSNLQLLCSRCNSSKGTGDAPGHAHIARVVERTFEDARRATNGHH